MQSSGADDNAAVGSTGWRVRAFGQQQHQSFWRVVRDVINSTHPCKDALHGAGFIARTTWTSRWIVRVSALALPLPSSCSDPSLARTCTNPMHLLAAPRVRFPAVRREMMVARHASSRSKSEDD
jgi:hypothetical protein